MRSRAVSFSAVVVSGILLAAAFAVPALSAPSPKAKQGRAEWTFAIYMCSDNDLDYWGHLGMEWLMSVGSTSEVNFIVLWDPEEGSTGLYKVEKDTAVGMADFPYHGIEVNMGDPAVLEGLVDYLGKKFPSDYLLVDLWDHGDDFRGVCFDYNTGTGESVDYLTHQEITSALAGKEVDVLAVDGCGLGIVEAAYEYAVNGLEIEYFVASGNYVPLDGFPYDVIASDLVANPGMSPEELSEAIVQRYEELYTGPGWLTELAAVRLSEIPRMAQELWDLTSLLAEDVNLYHGMIASGRAQATMGWSQYGWEALVDFPTIFEVIYEGAQPGSELQLQAQELLIAIDDAVPYVGVGTPAKVWNPGGISIFFPNSMGSFVHNEWWRGSIYPTMQFAQDGWLDFLFAYYGVSDSSKK